MNNYLRSIVLIATVLVIFACQYQQPIKNDLTKAREEIMRIHQLQREYHFQKDSIAFANQLSDNFISVNRGNISFPSKEETISRYNRYFSSVEFVKWDDVSEPIIRFSDDGSLAYAVVDKQVILTYKDEQGEPVEDTTHFAWTTIYRKYDDQWKIDCVTSTNEPMDQE